MKSSSVKKKNHLSKVEKFIKIIEKAGNKLPHPLTIFTFLAGFVLVLSYFLAKMGVSVTYMAASRNAAEAAKETTIAVVNLLSKEELQGITMNFVKTYITFFPIGLIVVMMLGVSVAEKAGLISALMKRLVLGAPGYMVTFIVAIVGICANLASDAGIVFAPAIGGAIFFALGRHPIAGILAGYVAAYGGFSANLLIAGTDALLAGVTQSVTSSFGIEVPVHPLMNWYVMSVSTLMLGLIVTIVTEKIIIPVLGKFDPVDPELALSKPTEFQLTDDEKKGLKAAGIVCATLIGILLLLIVPENAFFRNEVGELLPKSPLTKSILFIIFTLFILVGIAYGKASGTIKSDKDIAKFMQEGLVGVAGFLVVCLPASMFITWFSHSNISTIIAVKGANILKTFNISGIPLILLFVLLSAGMNLFITSGSSKWLILAPIFVPMFYMMNISPAATQMAYRIGDSTTNIISPVSAYLPVILGLMEKYRSKGQNIGIGTVISLTLPYSIVLVICWMIFFSIWLLLGLPMGPGAQTFIG
ncbi:MAG: AbgT family transporter [Anaeromicrobium sp.]|jgi:aminobenzoyl-glutamate transport protein|uniref:AbgT family transporter n=1 Tax=Anaeromicrobium sp. TaxID=1929132 RepID=UPI0025DD82D9|nr:AbgT family transporter [Anaeromicrobium sp.]MCT4595526.1 AbgT family transporter [Anaeromicrobium sp.]